MYSTTVECSVFNDCFYVHLVYKQYIFYSFICLVFLTEVQLDDSMFRSYNGSSSSTEISENVQLPDTVTKLLTPYRSVVYVVGTAHFSESSQEDVRKVTIYSLYVYTHCTTAQYHRMYFML